jgi:hypothetical protein
MATAASSSDMERAGETTRRPEGSFAFAVAAASETGPPL